jgi:hypothetical protein
MQRPYSHLPAPPSPTRGEGQRRKAVNGTPSAVNGTPSTVNGTRSQEVLAPREELRSQSREVRSQSREVRTQSGEVRTQSREVRTQSRKLRALSREFLSLSREVRTPGTVNGAPGRTVRHVTPTLIFTPCPRYLPSRAQSRRGDVACNVRTDTCLRLPLSRRFAPHSPTRGEGLLALHFL